jgi:hypothetical protein
MDFAIMSMVAEVTERAPPSKVHVGRSSQGPLLMRSKKSLRGPREVHFFGSSKIADIVYKTLTSSNCPPWSSWLGTGLYATAWGSIPSSATDFF